MTAESLLRYACSRITEIIMDQEKIHLAVQALWLKYKGLTIEAAHSWHRIDNAGYRPAPPPHPEDLPEPCGHMVAT